METDQISTKKLLHEESNMHKGTLLHEGTFLPEDTFALEYKKIKL